MKKYLMLVALAFVASNAAAAPLFSDNFNYSDGPLTTVSGGIWANHSGTTNQVDVQSGAVNLTANESEDVNAQLAGGPYTAGLLYYSLTVNFSVLPAGGGNYFAHLKDTTTGFRARLFATTNGAAFGSFRLAINNGSTPLSATFGTDLALGSTYRAVVRYDVSAAGTTLWVDPSLETDPSVSASDVVTGISVTSIALRQSRTTGPVDMGTLTVDNLRVGTSFVDVVPVVPEPSSIVLVSLGGLVGLLRLRRKH